MTERYEVTSGQDRLPVAINLKLKDAEYVDFNQAVLNPPRSRRNPAGTVAEVEVSIAELLNASSAPSTLKKAKKAANALGLSRREVSEIVQQLNKLYTIKDVLIFPEFSQAIAQSLTEDLSKNQSFYLSEDLVAKIIECQASAFRTSVSLGSSATYEGLSKKEKVFLQDLLLLLDVFVGVDPNASHFVADSTFFESLGSLTPVQIDALCRSTENITFSKMVGAHYAPYVMLTLQCLFTINSDLTIQTLTEKPEQTTFDNLYTFLDQLPWDETLGNALRGVSFNFIAVDMQGTGVDAQVVNVCLHCLIGTDFDWRVLDKSLRKVLGSHIKISESHTPFVSIVFLLAKAINLSTPDLKVRNRNLANAYALKPEKALGSLLKTLKKPPSVESSFIWENYINMDDVYEDNDVHYLEWGFSLFAEIYKAGLPNYDDDPTYDQAKDLTLHLNSPKGQKDLQLLIDICEAYRELTNHDDYELFIDLGLEDMSQYDKNSARISLRKAVLSGTKFQEIEVGKYNWGGKAYKTTEGSRLLERFESLSLQSLPFNLFVAALTIPDPYNLLQFKYESVTTASGAVVAISKPYNPVELVSGFRTLGACCMLPYQPGTYASMSSFYGSLKTTSKGALKYPLWDVDRTAYIFADTDEGHICMGTMFLPLFDITYDDGISRVRELNSTPQLTLSFGPTQLNLDSKGLIPVAPEQSRSYDGWESNEAEVPSEMRSTDNEDLITGILTSSVGVQMGLVGSAGDSPNPSVRQLNPSHSTNHKIVRIESSSDCYLDYSSPEPTIVLAGEFPVENPSVLFSQVAFLVDDSAPDLFKINYTTKDGVEVPLEKVGNMRVSLDFGLDIMKYIWSFPKMDSFIPLSGSVIFKVKNLTKTVQRTILDLVIPEWFIECDENPLIRSGKELRTDDIINMRRPVGGIALVHDGITEYIVEPKGR